MITSVRRTHPRADQSIMCDGPTLVLRAREGSPATESLGTLTGEVIGMLSRCAGRVCSHLFESCVEPWHAASHVSSPRYRDADFRLGARAVALIHCCSQARQGG